MGSRGGWRHIVDGRGMSSARILGLGLHECMHTQEVMAESSSLESNGKKPWTALHGNAEV